MTERLPTHGETGWDTIVDGFLYVSHNADGTLKDVAATTQAGTTYTLALADWGTIVEFTSASAVTVTVPPNASVAFPVGTAIELVQYGAGQVSVAAGAGVTIRSPSGKLKLTGQYSAALLRKRATNEWFLQGDIAT